jgi:hypothetical protein
MSTDINRRSILTGAASALPAIAVFPAVAGQVDPDGELLALSAQLDQILKEREIQDLVDIKRSDEYKAAVEQATGIADSNKPSHDNDPTGYWAIRGKLFRQYEEDRSDIIDDRFRELCEDILGRTAHTRRGFAVQVRAINSMLERAGVEDDEAAFIQAACRFSEVAVVQLDIGEAPTAAGPSA